MGLQACLSTAFVRHYPASRLPREPLRSLAAARNERFSFQVVLRSDVHTEVRVAASGPAGWELRVRRVGYVPVAHLNTPALRGRDGEALGRVPGYVPDPLFDEASLTLPANETHAFWISARPGADAAPGRQAIAVTVAPEQGRAVVLRLAVSLSGLVLPPRRGFDVTHWFYIDALMDRYGTDLSQPRFWELLAAYVGNLAAHGQNVLYMPVFTPPLDGVKRPSQLLRVRRAGPGRYTFDWSDVRRAVRLAEAQGIERFEWCHLFTQWGARHAIRVYEGQGEGERLLWPAETGAGSATYRGFLAQFLPALRRFLAAEGLLERSLFHVSDEPHGEEALAHYRGARALLRELAPWMEVLDALTDIRFGRERLTDMPVPSIRTALDFVAEGIPCWCYYCCGPRGRYLNRLLDTPLAKIAMHGLLFYRWPFRGFLHWGANYWYESQTRTLIDPFTVQDGRRWPNWAFGDTFVVYPGPDGPIDSMRWEVFGESLQDYRRLQALGVARDDPRLAPLRSFTDFPKDPAWRAALLARLAQKSKSS